MQHVVQNIKDGLATVTICRQKKLNALNQSVLTELETCFEQLQKDNDVHVIILTGDGEKAFVAGADIGQFPTMTPDEAEIFALRGQEVFQTIESSPKPVIAAVNGFALGGGCELAMACHLRYAADTASFGQPEVKLGVIAGFGGTQRLPRLIGVGRALDILLSGRMVKSEEALQLGLVNGVFPAADLMTEVEKIARGLTEMGSQAQRHTLRAVYRGYGQPLAEAMRTEALAFKDVFRTEDHIEGANAFLERRAPDFKNR